MIYYFVVHYNILHQLDVDSKNDKEIRTINLNFLSNQKYGAWSTYKTKYCHEMNEIISD